MQRVQPRGDVGAINPRRAEFFKRRLGAAAHGDACALQYFDARIKNRAFHSAQIGRWRNPANAGALEKIVAMPVLHGDDVQIAVDMIFAVEKLRELADRERVSNRHRIIADEICFVGIEHRPFDDFAAKKIRPVQDVEGDVVLGGFFHAIGHRRRVGVEAHAGVLYIENERVDPEAFRPWGEAFRHRGCRWAVRSRIFGGGNLFVGAAGDSVLGAEQRDELHAGRAGSLSIVVRPWASSPV